MSNFKERLKGGHPNSLGKTIEVVEEVLKENHLIEELFNCYSSDDEVVRLRTSNAMKRIAKSKRELLLPFLDRFINEIVKIEQASAQWTLAQLFDLYKKDLKQEQKKKAEKIMFHNLANHSDWIVLNQSMQTLGSWAKTEPQIKEKLLPHLHRLKDDQRKSVAKKAEKVINTIHK